MRKIKQPRNFQTQSFSMPPEVADFMEKRLKEVGMTRSEYLSSLIRHDREENTIGHIARKAAERLSTPVAA